VTKVQDIKANAFPSVRKFKQQSGGHYKEWRMMLLVFIGRLANLMMKGNCDKRNSIWSNLMEIAVVLETT